MKNTGAKNYSCVPDSLVISFYSCLLDLNYDLSDGSDKLCESGDAFTDFLSFIKVVHLLRSNTINNRKKLNQNRNTWRTKYCKKYITDNRGKGFCSVETFLRPFCEDYKGARDDIPLITYFTSTFKCIVCQKEITVLSKEYDAVLANYDQTNNDLQTSLDYFSKNYLRRSSHNCPDCDSEKNSGNTAKFINSVITVAPDILIIQMNEYAKNIEAMGDNWRITFGGDVYCIRSIIWNDQPSTHFVTTSYFSGCWHYFDDFANFTSQVSSPISENKIYCNSVLLFFVKQ